MLEALDFIEMEMNATLNRFYNKLGAFTAAQRSAVQKELEGMDADAARLGSLRGRGRANTETVVAPSQ